MNFLCLLGWNPGDDREKMPIADIITLFDLPGVNQSNARFDDKKLAHMNMAYLLELPAETFAVRAREFLARQAASPVAQAATASAVVADQRSSLTRRAAPGHVRRVRVVP